MRTKAVRFVLYPAFFSPDLGCQKTQKYSFRYDSYLCFFRQKYESYRAKKTVRDDSYRNDTVVGRVRVRSYCNDTFREHIVLHCIRIVRVRIRIVRVRSYCKSTNTFWGAFRIVTIRCAYCKSTMRII